MTSLQRWLTKAVPATPQERAAAVPATPQERAAALWSFGYFFTLLAGYYVLRPLRDQMGIAGGVKALPWMFTATFVTLLVAQPLYGALVSRVTRARFIAVVYHFFVANLALFWLLLTAGVATVIVARVFFVLGQRVQPVCRRGVLVGHGRSLHQRAEQAPVRIRRRRGDGRFVGGSSGHDRPFGTARPDQPADRAWRRLAASQIRRGGRVLDQGSSSA